MTKIISIRRYCLILVSPDEHQSVIDQAVMNDLQTAGLFASNLTRKRPTNILCTNTCILSQSGTYLEGPNLLGKLRERGLKFWKIPKVPLFRAVQTWQNHKIIKKH